MNSGNSKTSDSHRHLDKYVALSNLRIYYTQKNIKKSYKNIKFKISGATWNEKIELPDESSSVSDIHGYFEYIIKHMKQYFIILQ